MINAGKEKILILGSTGLIGSALCRCLRHNYSILTPCRNELDAASASELKEYIFKFEPSYVVNAAGHTGGIVHNINNPLDLMIDNIKISIAVAEAALGTGVKRVINFCSSCMYPASCKQPMSEEQLFSGCPETTSLPYAVAKLSSLHLGSSFNKQLDCEVFINVIPATVYGPQERAHPEKNHVLRSIIEKAYLAKVQGANELELWGTGTPRREFIYSDDLADAIRFLIDTNYSPDSLPLNIGSGVDYSIKQLAEIICDVVGFTGNIIWNTEYPDGVERKLLDSGRVNQLGWTASTNLKEGVHETFKNMLVNH